jgi:triphosphoribosyl-dephospho-CoA synthase
VVEQDVARTPTQPLVAVMALARERDAIAREYVTAFETTFTIGAAALSQGRAEGLSWADAVVEGYLTLLAAAPDTHLARRHGMAAAVAVQQHARAVVAAGGVRTAPGREAVAALDRSLRTPDPMNPGATADLTTAAIFVTLLEGASEGGVFRAA